MDDKKSIDQTEIIRAEIPIVEQMFRDETWYEGERRHQSVDQQDPTIVAKVLEICLRDGKKMHDEVEEKMTQD